MSEKAAAEADLDVRLLSPSHASLAEKDLSAQVFEFYDSKGEDILQLGVANELQLDRHIRKVHEPEFFVDDDCNIVFYFRHGEGKNGISAFFNNRVISFEFELVADMAEEDGLSHSENSPIIKYRNYVLTFQYPQGIYVVELYKDGTTYVPRKVGFDLHHTSLVIDYILPTIRPRSIIAVMKYRK